VGYFLLHYFTFFLNFYFFFYFVFNFFLQEKLGEQLFFLFFLFYFFCSWYSNIYKWDKYKNTKYCHSEQKCSDYDLDKWKLQKCSTCCKKFIKWNICIGISEHIIFFLLLRGLTWEQDDSVLFRLANKSWEWFAIYHLWDYFLTQKHHLAGWHPLF